MSIVGNRGAAIVKWKKFHYRRVTSLLLHFPDIFAVFLSAIIRLNCQRELIYIWAGVALRVYLRKTFSRFEILPKTS